MGTTCIVYLEEVHSPFVYMREAIGQLAAKTTPQKYQQGIERNKGKKEEKTLLCSNQLPIRRSPVPGCPLIFPSKIHIIPQTWSCKGFLDCEVSCDC